MRELPIKSVHLLDWYDRNARQMPWRVSPTDRKMGIIPDPYHVWLSEIMLQQTTVAAVGPYFQRFIARWPTVNDLAAADDGDVMAEWAGLGYYARARNLLKCARIVADRGAFPKTHSELLKLPGIGPYTAAAISAIAYDLPETVVDGNVERVMARLFNIHDPLPKVKALLTKKAKKLTAVNFSGNYAQAVMDLGATVCTPRSPRCGICPWAEPCQARKAGTAQELPKKTPKAPKPTRRGILYIAQRADGALLLERRPDNGLLGGMLGWPGSEWGDDPTPNPPLKANWQILPAQVRHTFTHFHLIADIAVAGVPQSAQHKAAQFLPKSEFRSSDLPTVMRKAYNLAVENLSDLAYIDKKTPKDRNDD